jgi:hypothetical protein
METEIEVEICGHDLSYVNYDSTGIELEQADTSRNCKTIKLGKNQVMPIATASGIAEPLTYDDLGFHEIVISTSHGQIRATGEEIMNLFKIERKRNAFGKRTYDLYYIDVDKNDE